MFLKFPHVLKDTNQNFYVNLLSLVYSNLSILLAKVLEEIRFDTTVAVYNETNIMVFENLFKVREHN